MLRGSFVLMMAVMLVAVAGQDSGESSTSCEDRSCPETYEPVCGSDGKTYNNTCTFSIAQCENGKLEITQKGECPENPECPIACITLYDPVCGSDGQTYSNLCALGAARECNNKPDLTMKHKGECEPQY